MARLGAAVTAVIIGICATTDCANARKPDDGASPPPLETIVEQFEHGEYEAALRTIATALSRRPDDPVMLYNAACAHARLGNADLSGEYLLRAVKAGFMDFSHMRRDRDLEAMREHPRFRALLQARDAADPLLAERLLNQWKDRLEPSRYEIVTSDADLVTVMSPQDAERTLALVTREVESMRTRLFDQPNRHRVLIIVLSKGDAARWLPDAHAHGRYVHARRELIARGEGPELRHELAHMLHHHQMDDLGQEHPIWLQEGLASIFEDVIERDDGWRIQPNERRNVIKHLARRGRLIPWSELMTMDRLEFERRRIETYPHVRSMVTFIADRYDVAAWYRGYVDGFAADPTGRASLEAMFGKPLERIEHEWRAWLALQPSVIDVRGERRQDEKPRRGAGTAASVK